jgi:phytoene synthase
MDPSLAISYEYCRKVARREARNFYYAFRLLPHAGRRSMCALYAFMRRTDDLADNGSTVAEKRLALENWSSELDAALEGKPASWPGFPALAHMVAGCGIPPILLQEAIEGVSMDVEPRRYVSFDELANYCYHVASVVGLCCIHIWGYRSERGRAETLAEACGIALQLTNILRDVREDARNGRIYLPDEDMNQFGVYPGELDADRPTDRLRDLLEFEARRAYGFYDQARELVPLVDPEGRPVLLTIVGIYRALLDEIVRRDYNVLSDRVSVPGWRKAAIALGTLPRRFLSRGAATTTTAACGAGRLRACDDDRP